MKRRFQKIAALMLVGAMAGTLVTGCGGSSSGSSSDSSSDIISSMKLQTLRR